MTQTTTTATSPGSQGVVATGVLTTTVTDDSILASGWSVPIAVTDDSYFTSTPAAGKAALIQFSPDNVNWYFAASTPYVGVFTGGVPPSTLWIRAQGVGGIGTLAVSTPTMNIGVLTAAQAAAAAAQASSGFTGPTLREPNAPNGGMGKLVASFNMNTYPSMTRAGTVQNPVAFPVRLTLPGNFRPAVFTAQAATQHYCMTEIGDDATVTKVVITPPSITPTILTAYQTQEQTFSIATAGLARTDRITNLAPPSFQAGVRIDRVRVNNTDSIAITFTNTTAGSLTPTAGVYPITVDRCTTGAQSTNFNSLGIWLRCPPRADGYPYTSLRMYGYKDAASTDGFVFTVTVKADGVARFHTIARRVMAVGGSGGNFVLGVDRFDYLQIGEGGAGSTAVPGAGSFTTTSMAMTAWASNGSLSEVYHVQFSNGTAFEVREVQLSAGATTASWLPALPWNPTSALWSTTVFKQGATDVIELGPMYRDPVGKPFAYLRFDDGVADHVTPRAALVADFVGTSGVTIPAGVPQSAATLAVAFGLKPTAAILTSCVGKDSTFATVAQLKALQDNNGWCIGFQTHFDPISTPNRGIQLLGPFGYNLKPNTYLTISGVSGNVVTVSGVHYVVVLDTTAGNQGFPVELIGTPPAASLSAGQKVWLRNTSTTAFTIHLTELDASNNTNIVTLTNGAVSWDYRYWGSSPDGYAVQLNEFQTGQALMQGWGLNGWRHWLPNQGAWDASTERVISALQAAGNMRLVCGVQGGTGEAKANNFSPRIGIGYQSAGIGYVGAPDGVAYPLAPIFNLPVAFQTDGSGSAQEARDYVRALVTYGGIGGNYHHGLSPTNMLVLCAYMDEIRLLVNQGLLLTGNLDDLWSLMVNTGTAT